MTMPKGSRDIVVDGEAYRWCVSKGAIIIEHAASSRSVIREALVGKESIGPGRVARVVRHARERGWQPDARQPYEIPPTDPFADPRGRDDYTWRKALARSLAWFEACVGTPVELGGYWWEGPAHYASAGLGATLRWGPCPAVPEADHWEGILGISGNRDEPARVSVSGFPFRDGRLIREGDEVLFYFVGQPQGGEGRIHPTGWTHWLGPGEWDGVQAPGDLFDDKRYELHAHGSSLRLTLPSEDVPRHDRLSVALHAVCDEHDDCPIDPRGAPWFGRPAGQLDPAPPVELDISTMSGRWRPGRYQVALRISGLVFGEGEQSRVTPPVWVTLEK